MVPVRPAVRHYHFTHVFRRPFSPSTSGSPEVLGRPRGTATAWRGATAVDEGWFGSAPG